MNELKIELNLEPPRYEPGAQLEGTVSWTLNSSGGHLELRLFWFTRGKGTEDAGVVDTIRFDQPSPFETRSFRLQLPQAPYSFSGKLISLVWALELIAYPSKEVARREIEMGPQGREVILPTVASAPPTRLSISIGA